MDKSDSNEVHGRSASHPHNKRRTGRPESAAVKLGVEIYREEGDIEPLRNSLSARQRAFCTEYVVDFNTVAAMKRAGYDGKWAERVGYNLRHHLGCQAYIDYLTASKQAQITAIDPDYVISRITEIISKTEAKDSDKLRGLELLAKHLGMFIERTEITGKDGEAIKMEQKTQENVSEFKEKIKRLALVGGTAVRKDNDDRADGTDD